MVAYRRIQRASKGTAVTGVITHVVLFWLKKPGDLADQKTLIAGIRTLAQIDVVRSCRVGVPAKTEARDVVDHSFDICETLTFDSVEDQLTYQLDPIHLQFVERCSDLWERVQIYDVADAE